MFHSLTRNRCLALGMMAAVILVVPGHAHAQAAPSTTQFMRVLDAKLQQARPRDILKRTILLADVSVGEPVGRIYPFTATATIHDYTPGWPPERYFGKTCITRLVGARYNMLRDAIGEWKVETKANTPAPVCTDNPTDGKSAVPLDSLRGTRVGTSLPPPELMTKKRVNINLKLGEYACIWPTGRISSQMRFRLNRDKTYTDLEGARGGTYTYEPFSATIKFNGGFLDKMGGKAVSDISAFALTPSLTCSPWS
jgi:hypothetical protein